MSVSNLHSLFSGNWFIEENFKNSLLPVLSSFFKNKIPMPKEDVVEYSYFNPTKSSSFSSAENNNEDFVLMLSLKNPIFKYDQIYGLKGTKSKTALLKEFENNPKCKGVVLDIDSGGGQVSGTPEFYDFLTNYKKPIVAYTDGLMCSAAYYIGSASDYIIANKRCDFIGSIGVMFYKIDMTGVFEKKGAKIIEEYATKSTEKNKNVRELLKGSSKNFIKKYLDPINETFIEDIKQTRSNISEEVFTGAVYNAEQSLENGLIDEIGTMDTAIKKVLELSKTKNINLNNNSMSDKIDVPNIQAVLGYDAPFGANENGVFLQKAELETLNNHLKTENKTVADLKSKLSASDLVNSTATAVIDKALKNAEIDFKENATLSEKIALLEKQRNEFAKRPATVVTKVTAKKDTDIDEPTATEYAHDIEARKLLNN